MDDEPPRLDQYVVRVYPLLSRTFATKLIRSNRVQVNGEVANRPGYRLHASDNVVIDYDASELEVIPTIDLPILYEDEDCVVINKPAGVLTHSKGDFNPEATVATWLRSRFSGQEGQRAGIVHRLDRATSGIMICAKNEAATKWLQRQFSERKVKKTYYAVVSGKMPHDHAAIDMPIARHPKYPQTFRVDPSGKAALTEYIVHSAGERYSLIELRPQTGRTHQLRVHLSQIGHAIVGDTVYGGDQADRLFLHAQRLEITLPNRTRQIFVASLPQPFRAILKTREYT